MPKANVIDTNWTAGEVSPLMRGRVDSAKYQNGAELIENFIVRPQGGLWKRSGTRHVRPTKLGSTTKSVLVPFEFSDQDAYMLEFGAGYIHFYKDGWPLYETTNQEVEFFTVHKNGTAIQLWFKDHDSAATEALPVLVASAVGHDGTMTTFRLTFAQPHTLRTGCKVYVESTSYPTMDGEYTVTRISNTIVELQGSSYSVTATDATMYFHSLLAGDPVYVSGATNFADLTEKHFYIQSVETYEKVTLANTIYSGIALTAFEDDGTGRFLITTATAHGWTVGQNVSITGVTNYPNANGNWNLFAAGGNQFVLGSSTFAGSGAANGYVVAYPQQEELHTVPIEISTDYTEADLPDLYFAQSADVLYIVHPDYPPAKLSRLDVDGDRNDWLLADIDFIDGPYLPANTVPPNLNSTTPQNGAKYDDVYLVVSSYSHTATATQTNGETFLNADDNKYIEYREDDQWKLAQLGTLGGGETSAPVTIIDNVLLHMDAATRLTGKGKKRLKKNVVQVGFVGYDGKIPIVIEGSNASPGTGIQRVDPNDVLVTDSGAPGKIKSQFANTFGASDVGKYVRYWTDAVPPVSSWAQITKVERGDGAQATHGTAVSMAVGNGTGYLGTTGKFVITNETRTCTINSKRANAAFDLFCDTDVGRHIRLNFSGRWTWGKITAVSSQSQVSVTLYADIPRDPHASTNIAGEGRTYSWRLGAWSAVGDGFFNGDTEDPDFYGPGYPSVVCFHEQRLCFAATQAEPQTVWMSSSGDFENMLPTELDSVVVDDNAITYTIASEKANAIKWMLSGPTLLIGTIGAEWQVKSSSTTQEPITPTNILVTPHTSHGSLSTARPFRVGYSVLFVTRPGNKVRELVYDFGQDTFVGKDLTIISEHILRQGSYALRSSFQQEPHSIYWVLLNDGTLAGLTFDKDQEVYAWHRHSVDGVIESIATIPSADGFSDTLWMIVKRTINSATRRDIQFLEEDFYPANSTDNDDMFFVDSGLSIEFPSSTTAINGLHHLEGETVEVLADGVRQGTEVVTSGAITSDTSGTVFQVGLPFTAKVRSLPPEGGSAFGVSQGMRKTISKLKVRVLDSVAIEHGWHGTNGTLVNENFQTSLAFYTNTYDLRLNQPYDDEAQYTLQSSKPYPLNILSVTKVVHTHE